MFEEKARVTTVRDDVINDLTLHLLPLMNRALTVWVRLQVSGAHHPPTLRAVKLELVLARVFVDARHQVTNCRLRTSYSMSSECCSAVP